MSDDDKCTCQAPEWCGATRSDVIRISMRQGLNEEQADADFSRAQAYRRERGMTLVSEPDVSEEADHG